jgi:hypothetical protein
MALGDRLFAIGPSLIQEALLNTLEFIIIKETRTSGKN